MNDPIRRNRVVVAVLAAAALLGARVGAQDTRSASRPESRAESKSVAEPETEPKTDVSGIVLDAAGNPAAGVEIAQYWFFENGRRKRFEFLTTGPDGRFASAMTIWSDPGDPVALVAFTSDDLAAGLLVGAKDALLNVTIRLKPSIRVRLSAICPETGAPPEWINSYWSLMPDGGAVGMLTDYVLSKRGREVRILAAESVSGTIELRAPECAYAWYVYDQDATQKAGIKTLDGKKLDVEMRTVGLPAAFVARQRGKPAPDWKVTATRGAPADRRQPRDFRGKWLIVEFWGYW